MHKLWIASAVLALGLSAVAIAQQSLIAVRPIEPPAHPLPLEAASAGVTRFSFIAYGDTRGQADGRELQLDHGLLVDAMVAKIQALAATPFPVRFALQSGDAVTSGRDGNQWNVSYTPLIERLTRGADVPYFFAVGNHDVTGMPAGDPGRMLGLHNALSALSRLVPPEGSARRLSGYPTYAFGFGHMFVIALDSNIASDTTQLAWVTDQLEHLDHARYSLIIAIFHHPPFSSGPHGADTLEPQTVAIRNLYAPLFRRHHVRMTITGHDHLLDHFVERYEDNGVAYRRDDLVTGGGGAPTYVYKGEPDLRAYLAAGVDHKLQVDHLLRPGPKVADNPHHFLIIRVDGDRLSLDVVRAGPQPYKPYAGSATITLDDRP
jgi:hypothetical protein